MGCSQILGIGSFHVGDADVAPDGHGFGQASYLKASNTDAGDQFGTHIAASADGSTIAISALTEDGGTSGVGGNEADNTKVDSGAVYVFVRAETSWTQQAYLKASNTDASDGFGRSVAISADGNTIVVGANLEDSSAIGVGGLQTNVPATAMNSGAAYVFARTGITWAQTAYLKPQTADTLNEDFGFSVAISGDGTTIAVGTPHDDAGGANSGSVFTYKLGATNAWANEAKIVASNPEAGDDFGYIVALSNDGNTIAVGAPLEDSAATGIGGLQSSNGALDAGAVYVSTRSGATWTQQAYIKASNTDAGDQFGHGVGLSADGSLLVVGAPIEASSATTVDGMQADNAAASQGAGYVFTRTGASWAQTSYLKAPNGEAGDRFGDHVSVAATGTAFVVSANGEDSGVASDPTDNSAMSSGAVYMFVRAGPTWAATYLKAAHPGAGDLFGEGLSMLVTNPVIGAPFEDSKAAGIDGDQLDESAMDAGAAFVFE